MPHTEVYWKDKLSTLQSVVSHERLAATEWRKVAEKRLSYLVAFDASLGSLITSASKVEKIFNVDAPRPTIVYASEGASGEEVARLCKDKLQVMVSFITNLMREALRVDSTLTDVYAIAQEALMTSRPQVDLVPTNLAEELAGEDWEMEYEEPHPRVPSPRINIYGPSTELPHNDLDKPSQALVPRGTRMPTKGEDSFAAFLHS